MANFRVHWVIDVEDESPHDAAAQALKIQRDPKSIATMFNVIDEEGRRFDIDVLDLDIPNLHPASPADH